MPDILTQSTTNPIRKTLNMASTSFTVTIEDVTDSTATTGVDYKSSSIYKNLYDYDTVDVRVSEAGVLEIVVSGDKKVLTTVSLIADPNFKVAGTDLALSVNGNSPSFDVGYYFEEAYKLGTSAKIIVDIVGCTRSTDGTTIMGMKRKRVTIIIRL